MWNHWIDLGLRKLRLIWRQWNWVVKRYTWPSWAVISHPNSKGMFCFPRINSLEILSLIFLLCRAINAKAMAEERCCMPSPPPLSPASQDSIVLHDHWFYVTTFISGSQHTPVPLLDSAALPHHGAPSHTSVHSPLSPQLARDLHRDPLHDPYPI
jgi:hypothetical protein